MDFLFFFGLFHCIKSQFRYSNALSGEDTHLQQINNQPSENTRSQQDQDEDFMLQESSVIEQDQITLPHNNEVSSTHIDEVLPTANENNCELNESVVKRQLLPPCKCKRNCKCKINEDRRSSIHDQHWKLPYNYRRTWIHNHVKVRPTKHPRKETKESYERSCTRLYILEDENNSEVVVYKIFFLDTLGYSCEKVIIAITIT